jgi:hypothetical protein
MHVRRDHERLEDASIELAEEPKTWVASFWRGGAEPAAAVTEVTIGEANLGVTPAEAAELYAELLRRSA